MLTEPVPSQSFMATSFSARVSSPFIEKLSHRRSGLGKRRASVLGIKKAGEAARLEKRNKNVWSG